MIQNAAYLYKAEFYTSYFGGIPCRHSERDGDRSLDNWIYRTLLVEFPELELFGYVAHLGDILNTQIRLINISLRISLFRAADSFGVTQAGSSSFQYGYFRVRYG